MKLTISFVRDRRYGGNAFVFVLRFSWIVSFDVIPTAGLHFKLETEHVQVVVPMPIEAFVARPVKFWDGAIGKKAGPMGLHDTALQPLLLRLT